MIDISKLDKADVLCALYNNSKPLGLGIIHFTPEDMEKSEAEILVNKYTYFDYLKGRIMKVDITGDELDPRLYDRDNGEGATQRAIDTI